MSGGMGPGPGIAHDVGGGPPPSFPTNSVLDNFNRANTGPPPSGSWAGPILTTDAGLRVLDNVCIPNAAATASDYWNTSFNADQEVYGTILSGFPNGLGFWLRTSSPNTASADGIEINIYGPSGGIGVYDVVDGSYSGPIGGVITQSFTDGDSVGATVIGNTVSVYYKVGAGAWTLLDTRTTGISGAGYIGIRAEPGVAIDDFGGGNI